MPEKELIDIFVPMNFSHISTSDGSTSLSYNRLTDDLNEVIRGIVHLHDCEWYVTHTISHLCFLLNHEL